MRVHAITVRINGRGGGAGRERRNPMGGHIEEAPLRRCKDDDRERCGMLAR